MLLSTWLLRDKDRTSELQLGLRDLLGFIVTVAALLELQGDVRPIPLCLCESSFQLRQGAARSTSVGLGAHALLV